MEERRGGVLVAGAINTDLVGTCVRAPEAGETVTGSGFAIFGGGKGANQAVAAARAGATTAMLGAVGADDFGRQRLADLRGDGIDTTGVATMDGVASGVALIAVEDAGENRILYVPGATLSVTPEQATRAFDRVRPGVVLMTLELPAETLRALQALARAAGSPIVLNATPDPEGGRALAQGADALIVNEGEARALLGTETIETPWDAMIERLAELGPPVVVVTLGARGVVVRTLNGATAIPAPAMDVVDTTGAGDAFCGVFAARLAEGWDAVEAARDGAIGGSLAVTKSGAQPSMPTAAEIASHRVIRSRTSDRGSGGRGGIRTLETV